MEFENILVELRAPIAVVTINRPRKLNNVDIRSLEELGEAFLAIRDNDDIRGVILTGAGERAFVSGADIAELQTLNGLTAPKVSRAGQNTYDIIENLGKPVIAAVHGYALGGGCELAMACTLRCASDKARFGLPEVNLGIIPGYGGTQRLARLVGKGRAMDMVLTGEMVKADEALRIGLVNKVFPKDELLAETEKYLELILAKGPVAIRYAIDAVNRSTDLALADGQFLESSLFGSLAATEDFQEGMKAFLEKRKAEFKNR